MLRMIRSPVVPLAAGIAAIALIVALGPAGAGKFKYIVMMLVWGGILYSAMAGYIYTPNLRIERGAENGREFWSAWGVSCVLALLVSYLALQLPF
jgi:hypothetical protein